MGAVYTKQLGIFNIDHLQNCLISYFVSIGLAYTVSLLTFIMYFICYVCAIHYIVLDISFAYIGSISSV